MFDLIILKFSVYPQKQQYAYATGYPVPPPQAYTGPYYTTGSAYGPYNYWNIPSPNDFSFW